MSNRIMLINGRHAEELRVAIVEDGTLQLYDVEGAVAEQKRGNIYRGVVTNIERSLNAAFVDFGDGKQGFLTRHDVIPQAFHRKADDRAPIDKILQKGQSLIVQITRDAEGSKGAALTTNLSIAGRFLVFFPYDEQRGVSRKVEDEALRRKLREKAKGLDVGEGEGFIVRTNGADQTKADLKVDLTILKRLWKAVLDDSKTGQGAKFLYNDQDLLIHSLRDNLDSKINEVLIDDEQLHAKAQKYLQAVMPRSKVSLKNYTEHTPLFSRYNIEPQIAGLYLRTVSLPCRGSIVIDHTEALTAIDVNSGKAKVGKTQGDTAYQTNLEAAAEVARQLRLRDIGGLVVVDFIDMRARQQERAVEKVLKEAMKQDRARHQVGRISENGLVEINRQRIRRPLQLRTHQLCPTCDGVGQLLSPELLSLSLIRRISARAAAGQLVRVRVGLHPELANFTQNHRRREISEVEQKYNIQVEIVGDLTVELSGERLEWIDLEKHQWPTADARPKSESKGASRRKDVVKPPVPSADARPKSESKGASRRKNVVTPPVPTPPVEAEKDKERELNAESSDEKRPRRKRRRRGRGRGRGRNGRAQEQTVQGKGERHGETPPGQATPAHTPAPARPPASAQPSTPALKQSAAEINGNILPPGEKPLEESIQTNSRRRRGRRRYRPRAEAAAGESLGGTEQSKAPTVAGQNLPQTPTPRETAAKTVAPPRPAGQRKPIEATPPPVDRVSETRTEPARESAAPQGEAPREAAPEKKTPKETAPKETTPKEAAPKKTAPKKAAPKKAAPKKAAPKKAAPKKAAPKKEAAPKKAAPKKAAPKEAAPKKAAPKKAAPKKAAPKKAAPKKAAPKKAAPKKAAPKKAAPKKEAPGA